MAVHIHLVPVTHVASPEDFVLLVAEVVDLVLTLQEVEVHPVVEAAHLSGKTSDGGQLSVTTDSRELIITTLPMASSRHPPYSDYRFEIYN